MNRHGTAEWHGGLKEGKGVLSTGSSTLNKTSYSFETRFEKGQGTNPEELIAAAHAGCFSMALAAQLEKKGFPAESIKTEAIVSLEKSETGYFIPSIHLQVLAKISGIEQSDFNQIANSTKEDCPVSKLMKAKITLEAQLEK